MKQELLYDYFYEKSLLHGVPVSVTIELLTKCNLRCRHCYIPEYTKSGFDFDSIEQLLNQLHELGVVNITFTGGEIFLRDDIFDIIALTRKLYMRVFLLSNGTLLDEKSVKKLADLYITEFSTTVFSMRDEIHDAITGKKGSLKKVLQNIRLLKKYNIGVKVKTPLLNLNAPFFEEVENFCEKEGYDFLTSALIFSKTNGDKSPTELAVKGKEYIELVKKLEKKNQRIAQNEYDTPCIALKRSFAIDCEGNVNPCNSFIYSVGNVYEDTVKNIWYHSDRLNNIKRIKNSDLKQCISCDYNERCRRCPALAFAESGDILGCDYYSKREAKILLGIGEK